MHIDYCVRAGVCWMKSSMSSATYRRSKSVTIGNVGLNSLERGHGQCDFNRCKSLFRALTRPLSIFQPPPGMVLFHSIQQMERQVRASPFTCRMFAGLRPGRISMNGAQYPVKPRPLFHCQHEFRQQVAGASGYDHYAQDMILHDSHHLPAGYRDFGWKSG